MATFGYQIHTLLVAAFWLIILRSVDGGIMIYVGGNNGWNYTPTSGTDPMSKINYQQWISSIPPLTVTDSLVFSQNVYGSVVQVTLDAANDCDPHDGIEPIHLGDAGIGYNLSSARDLFFSGHLGFIHPKFCRNGMKFTVDNVPKKNDHHKAAWIVGIVVGVVVLLAVLVLVAFMKRKSYWHRLTKSSGRKRVVLSVESSPRSHCHSSHMKDAEAGDIEWPWAPQRFSYKELKGATDSFNSSLVVGEGGFGTVYKGYLRDSPQTPVAVKRLSQYARQGAREFMAEVNIISQLRHRNLVQLLGWCDENEELILVYEYMPNGDVDDLIFGHDLSHDGAKVSPLSWKHRYNIFCGVATALVYLHEEWKQRVVHRDVKTSNVMLDSQFNARLGDFGLARLSAHSQAPRTTMVAGTIGYLAPEFSVTGRATDKTDVYAFGVVVLEVSCARRPLTSNCILLDWVWDLHKEERLLEAIDPKLSLKGISDEDEMKLALKVGLLCCHPNPLSRPTMRDVLNILTGKTPLQKIPRSKPVAVFAEDL